MKAWFCSYTIDIENHFFHPFFATVGELNYSFFIHTLVITQRNPPKCGKQNQALAPTRIGETARVNMGCACSAGRTVLKWPSRADSCLCMLTRSQIPRMNQLTSHCRVHPGLGNSSEELRSGFFECQFDEVMGEDMGTSPHYQKEHVME
jgi:hypothetical protein